MNRLAIRLLALLHALGVNPPIVAGLIMTPAVVAVGYLTNRGPAKGAPTAQVGLRGSFDAFSDNRISPDNAGADVRRGPDRL